MIAKETARLAMLRLRTLFNLQDPGGRVGSQELAKLALGLKHFPSHLQAQD